MKPSSVNQITAKPIYFAAVEMQDDSERSRYINESCGENQALRREVEQLLVAHGMKCSVLSRAVDELNPQATDESCSGEESALATADFSVASTHPVIDRYKLLEEIGRGGMGTVYMAQQTEPVRRRVALKVINPGMDSREVIARFEAERQALAMMDHPNIARVFDGGTTAQGHPYFVMELVRGIPITEYCDKHQLSLEERLQLFIHVCQAVQHAHQKGIIHRDLKPSNVQITSADGKPLVKVIDFGVAKALHQDLTDRTLYTQFHQLVGTPLYMSPEQAERHGIDVDTRSDIYSLGVLLYELLTATTPFDREELSKAGIDGARKMICEVDPPRPSVRVSTLKAGQDASLNVERGADRRKRFAALRGDLDWIVMKALEKDRNERYESASALAQDIQRHLENEPIEAKPATTLNRVTKWSRRHAGAVLTTMIVAIVLALVAFVVAWLLARSRNQAIEERQRAEAAEQAAELEAERNEQITRYLTGILTSIDPRVAMGRDTTFLREILDDTAERVSTELAEYPAVEAELSETIAQIYRSLSKDQQAERLAQRAFELRKEFHGAESLEVVPTLTLLANVYRAQGRNQEAEEAFRKVLDVRQRELGNEHPDVADTMCTLGDLLRRTINRRGEAEQLLRESLEIRRQALGDDHPDVASSLGALGRLLNNHKRIEEAEQCFREALEIQQLAFGREAPDTYHFITSLGTTLTRIPGKKTEGIALLRESLDFQKRIYGVHKRTANLLFNLARLIDDKNEAEQFCREAIDIVESIDPNDEYTLISIKAHLASLLVDRSDLAAAEELLATIEPHTAEGFFRRARIHQLLNQDHEAVADYRKAVELVPEHNQAWRYFIDRLLNGNQPNNAEAIAECTRAFETIPNDPNLWAKRAEAYLRIGQYQNALSDAEKSLELDPDYKWAKRLRGIARVEAGEYEQAIAEIQQVVEFVGISYLSELPPAVLAKAPDSFRQGLLQLAKQAFQESNNASDYRHRGHLYGRLGEKELALADFSKAIELEPDEPTVYYRAALLQLGLGNLEGYRKLCSDLLQRFRETEDTESAHWTAWTCALAPDAVDDLGAAVRLAEQAFSSEENSSYKQDIAAILLRAQQYEQSLEHLKNLVAEWENVSASDRRTSPAYTFFLLAMAHHHVGEQQQARIAYERAVQSMNQELGDAEDAVKWAPWNRQMTLRLLRDEAKTLLDETPSPSP